MLSKDDVGKLFTTTGEDAWKLLYFMDGEERVREGDEPMGSIVLMQRLDKPDVIRDTPEALAIRQFKRLVVEEDK